MYNDSLEEAKITGKDRERLDDLIALYIAATDPEADYYYDGDVPDYEKILKDIEKEFGSKIAKDVGNGTNIFHYGKDNNQGALLTYGDPTKHRGARRITKSGKINKQDAAALKKDIRDIPPEKIALWIEQDKEEMDQFEADKKETEKQQPYDVLPKYVLYKDQDRMKVMKGKIVKQWIDDRGKLVFKTSGGTTVYADAAEEIIESKVLGFKAFVEKKQPKTIKVGEDAVAAKSTQYALIKDRKIIAIGEKEELLQQSQSGGRVWIVDATKKIGDLVESK